MTLASQLNILALLMRPLVYDIRGGERRFLELAKRFHGMGINLWAIEEAPSLRRAVPNAAYKCLEVRNRFSRLPSPTRDLLIAPYIARATFQLLKRFSFDLIYVNLGDLRSVLPAYVVSRLARRPMVLIFHGIAVNDRSGFLDLVRSRVRDGFSLPFALFSTLLDFIRWLVYRKADACCAVSKTTATEVAKRFNIDRDRLFVTGNGVDLEPRHDANSQANGHYDAAYCGSLEPTKGIETLLYAWRIVASRLPSARLLLIGGRALDPRMNRYRHIVRDMNLQGNVVFAGHVPSDEVSGLLAKSKVFVFPSKAEGLPLAVLEAMACGLPCIVSDIPEIRENFGQVAMLVKPGDTDGLSNAILGLLGDEERSKALGLQAKEYVKRFGWDEVAHKELQVFLKVLCESGRQSLRN